MSDIEFVASKEQLTLQFLFQAADVVKSRNSNTPVIRTSLLKGLEALEAVQVPENTLRACCKQCRRPWNEGNFKMKILPRKIPGKRIRKIMRRKEKNPEKLTYFQKKLLLLAQRYPRNKLVLTCLNCKKTIVKVMPKHKPSKELPVVEKHEEKKNKRKRKRKDLFVGLNPQIVLKTVNIESSGQDVSKLTFKEMKKMLSSSSANEINVDITKSETTENVDRTIQSLSDIKKTQNPKKTDIAPVLCNRPSDHKHVLQSQSKTVSHISPQKKVQGGSFFRKLEQNKRDAEYKKMMFNVRNKHKRSKLAQQLSKAQKQTVGEFKNLLRDFGKPGNS